MSKIIIFGTGDIAQIASYYFEIDSPHDVVAFTVNEAFKKDNAFEGKPVINFEKIENRYPPNEFQLFIGLSYTKMNKIREQKYNESINKGYKLASYISSRCTYLSQFQCGDNCFIFEDNTIQPFVKIGNNVTLWSGNHIGHHSKIDDHNFISSHVVVSGNCHIKSNCFLGVNSSLHNQIILENETLVAAGAVISKNTIKKGVYLPGKTVLFKDNSEEINF